MKIFITGASGNLGQHLIQSLSDGNELLLQYHSKENFNTAHSSINLDILDFTELRKVFNDFKPGYVIHTAAVSNPKFADELPREKVLKINVEATKLIAALCCDYGTKLIFTSTDLVYDGSFGKYLKEEDPTNPLSLYAETKLIAEEEIQKSSCEFVILRTSLLYGFSKSSGENHFSFMFENLKKGKHVKLFTDQFRTPLAMFDAAGMIKRIIDVKNIKGVINFGGLQRLSRFELGKIFCESAGFNSSLLTAIKMDDIDLKYKVPDVSMDIRKLGSFGIEPMNVKDAMNKLIKERVEID